MEEWRAKVRRQLLKMEMDSTLRRESTMSQSLTWEWQAWQANRETLVPA
jgi:hypothetical protein